MDSGVIHCSLRIHKVKKWNVTDGNWRRRERSDEAVNKSEGQAWLCLRQVVLDQRFLQHYELNDFRSRQLSKVSDDTPCWFLAFSLEIEKYIC